MKRLILCFLILCIQQVAGKNTSNSDVGVSEHVDSPIQFHLNQQDEFNANDRGSRRGIMYVFEYDASDGTDFDSLTSQMHWDSPGGAGTKRCIAPSTEPFADHEIIMEPKDVLDGVRVWVDDNDIDDNLRIIVYKACLPKFAAGAIEFNVLLAENFETDIGEDSEFFNMSSSFAGRHDLCKMMVRVRFGSNNQHCAQSPDVTLQKVRVQIIKNDVIFVDGFNLNY